MNVMMTGRRRCALALLLAALVLSGCGKKDAPDAPEQTAQTLEYSNLSDEASKELLSELFATRGPQRSGRTNSLPALTSSTAASKRNG